MNNPQIYVVSENSKTMKWFVDKPLDVFDSQAGYLPGTSSLFKCK